MAGIYIHIPFCKRRCIYCDFYSTTQEAKKDAYIEAVCRELALRRHYTGTETIRTIYLGGGTPSQLSIPQLKRILDCVYYIYKVEANAEITLEANPDDLTPAYVAGLRQLPFNRISIGVQTFNDRTLALLNRRHTAAQASEAVRLCQASGFQNISIDLMYGLPQETPETWADDLKQALALNVQHLSAYHLIYEAGTPLWALREQHQVKEVDEDSSLLFFERLMDELKAAGFEHYEISNFARPGYRSRHNSSYWSGDKYLGCGPSAHSYNGVSRQWNTASLTRYLEALSQGKLDYELEELDLYTRYNDTIITAIRTSDGLSLPHLRHMFGETLYAFCLDNARSYLQQKLLTIEGNRLKLTREGIFVSDGIMSDLLWVDESIG